LIVDSTFTTPFLLHPIELGADIVIHSMTKWIGGGANTGGVVIDAGKFDWTNPKFTLFNEPDSSFKNLRFAHDFGERNNLAFYLRCKHVNQRNLGGCLSADNAWMFFMTLETLSLRMERHSFNAMKLAEYLKTN